MSQQTKGKIDKKWISFGILMLGAGTIYVPMQEFMGLSHTQIGTAMSIAGLISTFGFLASIYLTDRVSKKIMIPLSLICICVCGVGLSTFPSYPVFLLIYCMLAICADMLYWPTMLKTVVRYYGSWKRINGYNCCVWRPGYLFRARKYGNWIKNGNLILLHCSWYYWHYYVFPAGTGRGACAFF